MTLPTISVVIPAFNAETTLGRQLDALVSQQDAPPFEVILADNGSSDDTKALALTYQDQLDLRIVDASAHRGPSAARNAGSATTRASRIAFCDADDVVGPTWVLGHSQCSGMATGPLEYRTDISISQHSPSSRPQKFLKTLAFADSCNMSIDTELFRELDGFDLDFRIGQDIDISLRSHRAGFPPQWASESLVLVARRPDTRGEMRQFYRYGKASPKLLRAHQDLLPVVKRRESIRSIGSVVLRAHHVLGSGRRPWLRNLSHLAGRSVGSFQNRTWCI